MLADLFQIEMLQTTVSRIMKKNQDEHDFRLGHGWNHGDICILLPV